MKKFRIRVSGLFGLRDMLKTKNLALLRQKTIDGAPDEDITADFPINRNAAALHPDSLRLQVKSVADHPGAGAKTYILQKPDGSSLPYFRAGQYISLRLSFDGSVTTRPYSLCSSPQDALNGEYAITVKARPNGYAADRILKELKPGDEIVTSAPEGLFCYSPIRDEKHVIAVAGGSGITPFVSMASAIREGAEDFRLTILYVNRAHGSVLWKEKLDEICNVCDKVRVKYYLTREEAPGFRFGRPGEADIREAAGGEAFSAFVCGPEELCDGVIDCLRGMGLPRRLIRPENHGVTSHIRNSPGYPRNAADKIYSVRVCCGDRETTISARGDEPLLVAIERAALPAPSRCRSGECGWCRSRMVSGRVFIPAVNDGRRWADRQHGYIHPCAAFPLSDIELELPGEYLSK